MPSASPFGSGSVPVLADVSAVLSAPYATVSPSVFLSSAVTVLYSASPILFRDGWVMAMPSSDKTLVSKSALKLSPVPIVSFHSLPL